MAKVFMQGGGGRAVRAVEVPDSAAVEVLTEGLAEGSSAPALRVFLEDADEPVDSGQTIEEAGIVDGSGIHVSACPRVEVTVRYGGERKSRPFSPAQRLEHVFRWAASQQGFGVTSSDALDLALQLCGEQLALNLDDHVGAFVTEGCAVCLDLVPTERIQG